MTEFTKQLLANQGSAKKFFIWLVNKYGTSKLNWFANAEFIEQLGYFILYFEEQYNYHINCAENGFCVFYAKPAIAQAELTARFENGKNEFIVEEHYSASNCVNSIFITYERAIIKLFAIQDLPF